MYDVLELHSNTIENQFITVVCLYHELHAMQVTRSTLKCHPRLGPNIPSPSREPRPLRAHLDQPRENRILLVLFLRLLPANGIAPRIIRRDIRFADIAQYPAMQRGSAFLLCFRGMRIRYTMGSHEFGDAGSADDMAAWFGHYSSVRT